MYSPISSTCTLPSPWNTVQHLDTIQTMYALCCSTAPCNWYIEASTIWPPFGRRVTEWLSLTAFLGSRQWGSCNPYKPCNHNLYIGMIIFPHIDNPQSTDYNKLKHFFDRNVSYFDSIFWFKFHWSQLLRVWLIINKHCFRQCFRAKQTANQYLKQYVGHVLWHHMALKSIQWSVYPEISQNGFNNQ